MSRADEVVTSSYWKHVEADGVRALPVVDNSMDRAHCPLRSDPSQKTRMTCGETTSLGKKVHWLGTDVIRRCRMVREGFFRIMDRTNGTYLSKIKRGLYVIGRQVQIKNLVLTKMTMDIVRGRNGNDETALV